MVAADYVTGADLELAVSRLETRFEQIAHQQTRQMLGMLIPVYAALFVVIASMLALAFGSLWFFLPHVRFAA
jgi:hypothetical protein